MKSTGIVRCVDSLGKFIIPKELRKTLGVEAKDSFEIFTDEDMLIYKKYDPSCVFCGHCRNVKHFKGKLICEECVAVVSELV